MALKFWRDSTPTAERWTYTYNDLNQLTQRALWLDLYGAGVTNRWDYTYDLNGNLTQVNKLNTSLVQVERWLYEWNPRDQLTKVEKRTGTGAGTYAGKVEYAYCLSCDGVLAHRKQYDSVTSTKLTSHKRYEYDGLKLLRVDERCDADGDGEVEAGETTWRTVEASAYGLKTRFNFLLTGPSTLSRTPSVGDSFPVSQSLRVSDTTPTHCANSSRRLAQ